MTSAANPILRHTAVSLERAAKAHKAPIWNVASVLLSKPGGNKVEVNVGHLSRVASPGEVLLVPGKVLGGGLIDKKLVVGAFSFSAAARAKIQASGGSILSVDQIIKKYPRGSGVKLVG